MAVPIRALIAEDEALIAALVEHELQRVGVEIAGFASDGEQAVAQTCALRPDVVLMDVQMPSCDGLEATRRIQQCCPTPVVVLTVEQSTEVLERAADAGAGAYVLKPASGEELQRAITVARARFHDLLELRRLNGELRDALGKVKTLRGLLPICATCKAVRNDAGYWQRVDAWLEANQGIECSHGICPACWAKEYPDEPFPTA